jgi:hypothetical protein
MSQSFSAGNGMSVTGSPRESRHTSVYDQTGGGFYTTTFPATENPISESNRWINGAATGIDWTNCRTTTNLCFGTETPGGFDDSTAILTGSWSPNQYCTGVIHSINQTNLIYEEVELRLRSTITAHVNSGYELNFRCTHDGTQYTQLVRWNGALGDFTILADNPTAQGGGTFPGVFDGDTVYAEIVGTVITWKITHSGTTTTFSYETSSDSSKFSSGAPGLGFFLGAGSATNSDYGFTSYTASNL